MNDTSDELIELMREANRIRFDDPPGARRLYADAVNRCRLAGQEEQLIRALKGLGQIERDLGHSDAALELYNEAVTICRAAGDPLLLAHTVRHVGDIQQDKGRRELAEPCYQEALSIYRQHDETAVLDLANAVRPFAALKQKNGEIEEARRLWNEAKDLYAAANVQEGVAGATRELARLESKEHQ
ncbi:MAG TPA: tetratricopeptide repeat protein [Pyrinomonadaceae bacterium]|nr:tetratricopeptide repeat protein [Pyrinomonadaceae bacterium]